MISQRPYALLCMHLHLLHLPLRSPQLLLQRHFVALIVAKRAIFMTIVGSELVIKVLVVVEVKDEAAVVVGTLLAVADNPHQVTLLLTRYYNYL